MKDWDAVAAFALALPDTIAEAYYGGPAIKVASNRRAFVSMGREPDSFVLLIDRDTKDVLLETDPTPSGRRRITRAGRACWCAMRAPIPSGCAR